MDRARLLVWLTFLRIADLILLLPRPRLLWAYLQIWALEYWASPYEWPHSFGSVLARDKVHQGLKELMYGETSVAGGIWLLRKAGVSRDSHFLDLCAGRGRALLAARWLGAHTRGVELLKERVRRVDRLLDRVGIQMKIGDGATTDLKGATHIYITWTGFEQETLDRFERHLETCEPGTRVIAMDRPLSSPAFVTLSQHEILCTWGPTPVWVHEHRPGEAPLNIQGSSHVPS